MGCLGFFVAYALCLRAWSICDFGSCFKGKTATRKAEPIRIRPFALFAFALRLQRVVAMLVEHVALLGLQHAHPIFAAAYHHGFQNLSGALLPGVSGFVPA